MWSSVTQGIKQVLRAAGIEAHRFHPAISQMARLKVALRYFEIDLVMDVGANEGQFAGDLRAAGYSGRIVSFEPQSAAHVRLLQASTRDSAWHVHERCALGDRPGEIDLNISGNSVSSSILPMLTLHRRAAPDSAYVGHESAPLITLDSIAPRFVGGARAPFLKIDTQGYEWHVLDGARATLPRVRGIQIELSLVPLYEGQRLWRECIDRLEAEGFVLWEMQPAFVDPATGRVLQCDGWLFRP